MIIQPIHMINPTDFDDLLTFSVGTTMSFTFVVLSEIS